MRPADLQRGNLKHPLAPTFLPEEILRVLTDHGVRFVVVGGVAAVLHGSDQLTTDLDIAYDRATENVERLVSALVQLEAVQVTEPDNPAAPNVAGFTHRVELFVSPSGNIDAFAALRRVGGYDELVATAERIDLGNKLVVAIASIDSLIWSKSGTDRPKDANHVRSLERLKRERGP